jgi:hypothetical protein
MSYFAGIDLSTKAIDVVMLEEDTDRAQHHRRRLDVKPGKALERIRRIRGALPARTAWHDSGVLLIAIEEPYSRASMSGQVPILMAIGAILACLPEDLPVDLLRADDWRRACELPTRGPRDQLKTAAIKFTERHWSNQPTYIDDNAADAYCLAWTARQLHETREREHAA